MRKRHVITLLLLSAAVNLPSGQAPAALAQESYDVLIRGGRVFDGMGNPWIRADVALRGDRIVAVGNLEGTAARVVDASGLYVAPGFIDTHSHAGPGLATAALSAARPLVAQGITTVVINPDGGGEVDLATQRTKLLVDGLGVNVAQFIGHGAVREAVLGMADRRPTDEELERMQALVRRAMDEGGWGLSSGPFYPPGSYSDTSELVALAKIAAASGGVYQSHIRDESDYSVGLLAAVDEVITIAREARLPGIVTHIKALGPNVWGFSRALGMRIERARAEGLEVWADHYPYEAGATGLAAALLPRWAEADGVEALRQRLADGPTRARIRAEMVHNLARRGGADRIRFRRVVDDPGVEGRTLEDVARERKLEPVDLAMTMLERGRPSIISFAMHEDDVRFLMQRPWTMTASDGDLVPLNEGVPHPRSYGTFPRKIRHYAIEEAVIGIEAAIRSMTSLPARIFRMRDRGELRPGAVGDVVVFDPTRLRDVSTYAKPHQLAEGMVHVFVNGRTAIRDGAFTDERHGRILRRNGGDGEDRSGR